MSKGHRRLLGERVAVRVAGCPPRDGVLVSGVKKETKYIQKFPVRFPNGDVRTYRGDQLLLRGTRAPMTEYIRVGDIIYTKKTLGVIRFIGNHEEFQGTVLVMESVDPRLPKDPEIPSFRKLFPSANLSDSRSHSIITKVEEILKILPPDAILQQLSRIKDKYLAFVADSRAKDAARAEADRKRAQQKKEEEEARQREQAAQDEADDQLEPEATVPESQPPVSQSPKRTKTVTFGPGRLGIKAIWTTGLVEGVSTDGQAQKLGVCVGWRITRIEDEPYSEGELDKRTAGDGEYKLTFEIPDTAQEESKDQEPGSGQGDGQTGKGSSNAPLKSMLISETDKENYERRINELNEQIEDFQYTVESLQQKNNKLEEEHKEMTKLRVKVEHLRNSRVMFMSQIREMQKRVKDWKAKAEEAETKYQKLLEETGRGKDDDDATEGSNRRNPRPPPRANTGRRRPSKPHMPKPDAHNTLSLTNYQAVTTPKAGDGSSQFVSLSELNRKGPTTPDGPPPNNKKAKDKKGKKKRWGFRSDKGDKGKA